ncbi:hypothetical protein [Marinicellulosiphila megalodicopiae]|uniref:hypothetical protein n=1 Tax=Marinicellulosiphila megalodicopiae TaxID=2724896 RepID=UPI003BAFC695
MRKINLISSIATLCFVSLSAMAQPVLIDEFKTKEGPLTIVEQNWQDGDNVLNQFSTKQIKREHKNKYKHKHKKALPIVILASSFNVTIDHLSISSTGKYLDSFEAVLAKAGFEVWVIEDRMLFGDASICEQNDCSIMQTWGLDQRVEDIKWLKDHVINAGNQEVVVGGITGGGMAAIATVNRYPDDFVGVFSTGALYSNDIETQIHNMQSCDDFKMAQSQGVDYLNVLEGFDPVISLARYYPEQDSPIFMGLTNKQTLLTILGVPGFLGKNAYSASYVFGLAKTDLSDFKYVDIELFYRDYDTFGHLASVQHHLDINCAFTGERTFTDQLEYFNGDVLLLGGGGAMTPMLVDTGDLFTQANVKVVNNPIDGGEADNYLIDSQIRKKILDRKIIKWIRKLDK